MPTPAPDRASGAAFQRLAEVLYAGPSYESVYEAVCRTATEVIDGCDHASLMLRQKERIWTAAASDEVARSVDVLERELSEGPCVDAVTDEPAYVCADLTTGSPWPQLAAHVLAATPVRGMGGFRIVLDGVKVGALNVFSDTPGLLAAGGLDQAAVLTAFASVALHAVERGEEAETLRRGLESNREIGKAVGLLMAMHSLDDAAAFALLSRLSQDLNLKLTAVAARLVGQHGTDAGSSTGG